MKVICIDGNWNKGGSPVLNEGPKEGEIVTVLNNVDFHGNPCYELQEYRRPPLWEQENFIPISNIDETEMIRESILIEIKQ